MMIRLLHCLFVAFALIEFVRPSGDSCAGPVQVDVSKIISTKRLTTGGLLSTKSPSLAQCASLCHRHSECLSFNYNGGSEDCELMTATDGTFTLPTGWTFSTIDGWPELPNIGQCTANPCVPGSGCFDILSAGPICKPTI